MTNPCPVHLLHMDTRLGINPRRRITADHFRTILVHGGNIKINEMLPAIANEKLADYCDVFCEQGYYSKTESILILEAAKKYGIIPKLHAEQLSHSGGIEAGVETGAISVDHLEYCNDTDIDLLKNSGVMPTILPGAQFFLQLIQPPVRKMIDAGLPVAIASDYNPGTSPTFSMPMAMSLACTHMKMSPAEAVVASTINGAWALRLANRKGSIEPGKDADLAVFDVDDYREIPYWFGANRCSMTVISGEMVDPQ